MLAVHNWELLLIAIILWSWGAWLYNRTHDVALQGLLIVIASFGFIPTMWLGGIVLIEIFQFIGEHIKYVP